MIQQPSEEDVARLLFERGRSVHDARTWEEANVEMREWLKGHAAAVLALFAPILAEKERVEREWTSEKERADMAAAQMVKQNDRTRGLVALLDKQMGTPCEQIRHRQEVENLKARALAAEAALAAAVAALEPFADEKNGVMQDLLWGDQPDSATGTITTRLGHIRKAREVVRAAAIRAQGE